MMDRVGPRAVMELGVAADGGGTVAGTAHREPWHLYATLGVLVGGGSVCLGYSGQSLFLPNWFVRRRGLAIGIAFAGVGVGSIMLLPWLQLVIENGGWRTACWTMGLLVLVVLAPHQSAAAQAPGRHGAAARRRRCADLRQRRAQPTNVVDPAWAAVDWTLGRAMRTARFWWIALGYFCGLYAWYAVQVHQTKYLIEIGFSPTVAAWALGFVSLVGIPGQIALGHISDRIGREWVWTVGALGFAVCYLLLLLLLAFPSTALLYLMVVAQGALGYGLTSVFGGHRRRDLPGPALRHDLRHVDAGGDHRRRGRALGHRRAVRRLRQLHCRLLDRRGVQPVVGAGNLAGVTPQSARRSRPGASLARDGLVREPWPAMMGANSFAALHAARTGRAA